MPPSCTNNSLKHHSHMKPAKLSRTPDCGANYNALGYDPDGSMTWLVAFFFGSWVPSCPAHTFAGPPQPPRYGPPAAYQLSCLPEGFKPNPPPNFHSHNPTLAAVDVDDMLDPPEKWTPDVFAALRHTATFEDKALKKMFDRERKEMAREFAQCREDAAMGVASGFDGYETEPVSDTEEERYRKRRSLGNARRGNI